MPSYPATGSASPFPGASIVCGAVALLTVTGCPLSDDYFVESDSSSAGSAGASASGSACDTDSDPENCGSCGNRCGPGRACRAGSCASGWLPMAAAPAAFVARERAAFVAFGDELFIFGGVDTFGVPLATGAIYDVRTDSWKLLAPSASTPTPRSLSVALWTGDRILVWGGLGGGINGLSPRTGAFYDPSRAAWSPLPEGSSGHAGAAAGASTTHAVFWGGWTGIRNNAERYTIDSGRWEAADTGDDPGSLLHPAWAFTGSGLLVYGGRPEGTRKTDRTFRYSLTSNAWSELPRGPLPRWGSFGAWDGAVFYAWGGRDETASMATGAFFGENWTEMATQNAPSARWAEQHESGWAFALGRDDVVFLGGVDLSGTRQRDGGRYQRATGSWRPVPAWPAQEDHESGVAAHVGREIVVWGGRTGGTLTASGQRWAP